MTVPTIETERLVLRTHCLNDFSDALGRTPGCIGPGVTVH